MAFTSYSTCVQPQDYADIPNLLETVLVDLADAVIAPVTLGPVVMFEIETALKYLLDGKLVCLGGDRCAVGQIVGFEPPSDKNFPENIDNDFSFNVLLYPDTLEDFRDQAFSDSYNHAKAGVQGGLITEQPGMPIPHDPADRTLSLRFTGSQRYQPYSVTIPIDQAYAIGGWNTTKPLTSAITVPVLHCECEGSRTHDLLQTLEDIGGLGSGVCKVKVFGIPIGKAICAIVNTILAPIVAIALAVAWFKAQDGNLDDARSGGKPGELRKGNIVVVTGRWNYDAGHQGWNELHPVKSIQKIADSFETFTPTTLGAKAYVDSWCRLVSDVPPPDRDGPGNRPASMTPGQEGTWDNQRQPENRWNDHPAIDGCAPADTTGTVIR